jgi:hypothetical protein
MGKLNPNKRHGGPYDRGAADCYYRRPFNPHHYTGATGATYDSIRIRQENMTPEQIAEYKQGWDDNTADENFKEY